MKKAVGKIFGIILLPITLVVFFVGYFLKKYPEENNNPDTIQHDYLVPSRRNLIIKSINTTATAVTSFFDDVFPG